MKNILSQIIEDKRKEIEKRKVLLPEEKILRELNLLNLPRDFKTAISQPGKINLIAELKKASPSQGILRKEFEPKEISKIFEVSGASAISVLTEERYFMGEIYYLKVIKDSVSLPVLRKDFIIDSYQLYESRYYQADAILLIASLLTKEELEKFVKIAKDLSLEVMVEVHSQEDLEKTLNISGIEIIGINNRNLFTFEVDIETTLRLKRFIPEDKIVVSESGIDSYEDVMYLKSLGVNAVLIGEAFMRAEDISTKIKEVMGE
ncbi:MAG: indole-3-glycerol phosphate synthase TrpC [Candidatus Omnitrophica bacterium]|nr:indole-3-glycerol phosphate synthase TrpC [Candidatus Omnitrophota bacterium]